MTITNHHHRPTHFRAGDRALPSVIIEHTFDPVFDHRDGNRSDGDRSSRRRPRLRRPLQATEHRAHCRRSRRLSLRASRPRPSLRPPIRRLATRPRPMPIFVGDRALRRSRLHSSTAARSDHADKHLDVLMFLRRSSFNLVESARSTAFLRLCASIIRPKSQMYFSVVLRFTQNICAKYRAFTLCCNDLLQR